ncbi:MAG TPA: Hsp20/alpha crystallin family protein [Anaerolineae bacterium]|nr:Hsp20/alpha crystallin family protein [Anaerolineae bacterium]
MSNQMPDIPINLTLASGELVLHAPMPGAEPEDILILFDQDLLTLHSTMRGTIAPDKKILMHEWQVGEYHRAIPLAIPIDTARVNATYNNGVLTLAMPKGERTQPREIRLTRVEGARGESQGHSGQSPSSS